MARESSTFAPKTQTQAYRMENDLHRFYTEKAAAQSAETRRLRRKNHFFVAAELASFIAAIALVVAYTVWGGWPWLAAAAAMLAAYVAVRRLDAANGERMVRAESLCAVYRNELKYLAGDFSPFDDGRRYVDAKHPFTFDMDIFGPLSLYHRMCRCVTTGGADCLAQWLSTLPGGDRRDAVASIERRRRAACAMAVMEPLRSEFIATCRHGRIDTRAVREAIANAKALAVPAWPASAVATAVAGVACVGFAATIVLAATTLLPAGVPAMWGTLQFFVVFMACSKPLRMISKAVNSLHGQLKAYAELTDLMVDADLREISPAMPRATDVAEARRALAGLRSILDGLDRRGNIIGLALFDTFLLSDLFLVRRFLEWQRHHMSHIEPWIDNVSAADAMVSMATFRYNEPSAIDAEISDGEAIELEARGLRHPFLGTKAVGNDFTIADRNYYVVTGANMAGKSTFLRSVGVNYIMAMNGMPVFADRLRVTVFGLFSSMRTSDDLGHGISYFNAELLRLEQLMESCGRRGRTLIILDEILKGTNSLDKLNGSRMFLEAIADMPVSGLIATHDLELSKMSDERPERFHNWCFEIELSDSITYTYKITPGVARNQNATYLLRNIIAKARAD